MANQENSVRVTRLAKKRAMEAIGSQFQPANKKRVVLGELSSNPKVGSDRVQKKCGLKKLKKASTMVGKEDELVLNKIDGECIDPQMCETYALDIYEYLRNMEVCILFLIMFLLAMFLESD